MPTPISRHRFPWLALAAGAALCVAMVGARAAVSDDQAARYFEDALTRFEKKDIKGTIIQLKNVLKLDPARLPAQVLLGKALLANGEAGPAEVALNEAIRLGVNRAEVVVPLAQAVVGQGKPRDVLEQAQFSTAGLPDGVRLDLLLIRATAHSDLGNPRTALSTLDEARAIAPRSAGPWLSEVGVRIRAAQFREAAAAAARALELEPASAEAWYQKGSVSHVQGDIVGALSAYERAIQVSPDHVEARIARAGILLDKGKLAEARQDVDAVRRASPQEPRAAYLLGQLAEREGQPAQARAAMTEVTGFLDPVPLQMLRNRPQMLLLNGLSHFGLGNLEKAKGYLEQFQKVQGNSPVSKLLAQILLREKNSAGAIDVLETYLRAQPGDPQALTLLAAAHMSQGRHAKANALMQEALRAEDHPRFQTGLGLTYLGTGQPREAKAALETAYRRDPKQTQAGSTLAGLYLREGDTAKAMAMVRGLVSQDPSNATYQNLLGLTHMRQGERDKAVAAFEVALKLQPGDPAPQLNLARLDMADKAYAKAEARLEALLSTSPRNVDAMLEMAALSRMRGVPGDISKWLVKAVDVSGTRDRRAASGLINLHLQAGNPTAALTVSQKLVASAGDEVPVLLTHARVLLANGDAITARSVLGDATRLANFEPRAQVAIAELQLQANNTAGASYSLEKALGSDPEFLPAIALMTEVDLRNNETAKAEQRARLLVQRVPRMAVGHLLLGRVAQARGQTAPALAAFRQAHAVQPSSSTALQLFRATLQGDRKGAFAFGETWAKAHPNDVPFRKVLADGYAATGQDTAALATYQALQAIAPEDPELLNNLANVLLRLNRPEAVKVAEQALAIDPGNALVIDTLGWALHLQGQHDRALQLLRDARLREPGNAEIRYHLAKVLAHAGRRNEAQEELKVALADPRTLESVQQAEALMSSLR